MHDIFRGWRRKLGVLTLVTACVFMGAWVRSLIIADEVMFSTELNSNRVFFSRNGGVGVESLRLIPENMEVDDAYELRFISPPEWKTSPARNSNFPRFKFPILRSRWQWWGFGIYDSSNESHNKISVSRFVIPYWSITIPLTLISFWLLISPESNLRGNRLEIRHNGASKR